MKRDYTFHLAQSIYNGVLSYKIIIHDHRRDCAIIIETPWASSIQASVNEVEARLNFYILPDDTKGA